MNAGPMLLAIAAFLAAALCAAADGALLSADMDHLQRDAEAGGSRRERTHRALAMGRLVAYLVGGAALAHGAQLATRSFLGRWSIGIIATLIVVVLAEGAAREAGFAMGTRVLDRLRPVVRTVELVLLPAVATGAYLERLLDRLLPALPMNTQDREASAEQFREVVAAEADVAVREEALLHGVFSLGETEVQEIMVPRVDIVGIAGDTPWSEVMDRVRSSEHARFPVYDDTLDDITGILYAKDLLAAVIADEEPAAGWQSLVRPAAFVPTSKTIDTQLKDFKQSHTHIAIVSDEYGGTAGLVTIEDILEEIVGDINDEYDEATSDVEREGASRFWVEGGVTREELVDLLGTDFGHHEITTVGGLVYAIFGRVPRSGESIVHEGYRIVVERVRRRRVERVYFERLEPAGTGGER